MSILTICVLAPDLSVVRLSTRSTVVFGGYAHGTCSSSPASTYVPATRLLFISTSPEALLNNKFNPGMTLNSGCLDCSFPSDRGAHMFQLNVSIHRTARENRPRSVQLVGKVSHVRLHERQMMQFGENHRAKAVEQHNTSDNLESCKGTYIPATLGRYLNANHGSHNLEI